MRTSNLAFAGGVKKLSTYQETIPARKPQLGMPKISLANDKLLLSILKAFAMCSR
jgi:hypothetical protein